MPELIVKNLTKTFGDNTVLHDDTFTIKDGEFFTLLGASGCGKSTTLNCIAGLEQPTSGSISVGGTTFVDTEKRVFLPPEERNLGMVFQSYALWPHMTIAKNLALPLNIRKVPKDKQKTLIHEALDKVGLADLSGRYPHQLSGGQQQRVALARALVYSPTMLLLDEPLSNLDAKLREQARAWLKRLQEDLGHHHRLRHPRPGRGARAQRPDRRHVRRPHDPGRHPARDLRAPGHPRGGRLRRPLQLPHRARSSRPPVRDTPIRLDCQRRRRRGRAPS